jgi:hypothetical protein
MLHAMDYAHREINGVSYDGDKSRGYLPNRGTTWLTYITFAHRALIPESLECFLADAVNREEVVAAYAQAHERWRLAVKVDLPLAGTWAYLLDEVQSNWLGQEREHLRDLLRDTPAQEQFAALIGWRLAAGPLPLPQLAIERIDTFLGEASYLAHTCPLGKTQG